MGHGESLDMWFSEKLLGYILHLESTSERNQEKKFGIIYLGRESCRGHASFLSKVVWS